MEPGRRFGRHPALFAELFAVPEGFHCDGDPGGYGAGAGIKGVKVRFDGGISFRYDPKAVGICIAAEQGAALPVGIAGEVKGRLFLPEGAVPVKGVLREAAEIHGAEIGDHAGPVRFAPVVKSRPRKAAGNEGAFGDPFPCVAGGVRPHMEVHSAGMDAVAALPAEGAAAKEGLGVRILPLAPFA